LSKIHAGNRLSGPLGSGNRSLAAALELVALHFGANFLRLSKLKGLVKKNRRIFHFSYPHQSTPSNMLRITHGRMPRKLALQRQTLKDPASQQSATKPGVMPA
jgi:hypothetical protein